MSPAGEGNSLPGFAISDVCKKGAKLVSIVVCLSFYDKNKSFRVLYMINISHDLKCSKQV